MFRVPRGAPAEKEILEFSLRLAREESLKFIAEIMKPGGIPLSAAPAHGGEGIGHLWCRIVALEWDVVNKLHAIVKKPQLGGKDIWQGFLNGDSHPREIPGAEEIFKAMKEVRTHLIDVLRSAGNAIMDTVLATGPRDLEGTARFFIIYLPQHETALRARMQFIQSTV